MSYQNNNRPIIYSNDQSDLTDLRLDRGLHYGHGVFETLVFRSGQLMFLEQHCQRLLRGVTCLEILGVNTAIPSTAEFQANIEVGLRAMIESENLKQAVIKIIITAGSTHRRGYISDPYLQKPRHIFYAYPWPKFQPQSWQKGISVDISSITPSSQSALAGIKHLNRLENVLAANFASHHQMHDSLLLDAQGRLIETSSSNLFLVNQNSEIMTPSLDSSGVAGIIRQVLIDQGLKNDFNIESKKLYLEDLVCAKEVFITNSVRGVWPVTRCVGVTQDGKDRVNMTWDIGDVTKKLASLVASQVVPLMG